MMSMGNVCNGRGASSVLLRGGLRLNRIGVSGGGNRNGSVHLSMGLNEKGLESVDSVSGNEFCENIIPIVV